MFGNTSWPRWRWCCPISNSLVGTIFFWWLASTAGSLAHGTVSATVPDDAGGARRGAASWVATTDRGIDGKEASAHSGDAETLATNGSEPDLAANRAVRRGVALFERGEIEASIVQYRLAIDLKSDLASAWLNLGISLEQLGHTSEAVGAYKVVSTLPNASPDNVATALCNRGVLVQTHAGADSVLLEEGNSFFQRGLETVAEHPNCLYNFGLGMEKLGRYSEAQNLYDRALRANPFLGNAHQNIGNIAFRRTEWTEAISRYERAHASPDADQRLLTISSFMLGQLYRYGVGHVGTAVEYYKRAFEIDNNYTEALCSILQSLRTICLWKGWDSLEPRVASAIVGAVSSGEGAVPQSPYETRLTGQLKSSQHLGLARLASRAYDRVKRLPLTEATSALSFRRTATTPFGGRRQREIHDTGSFESGFGFEEWRHRQGITTGKGEKAALGRGRGEGGAEAAAGLVVAYWSYDFRDHAMGHLTKAMLCSHQA